MSAATAPPVADARTPVADARTPSARNDGRDIVNTTQATAPTPIGALSARIDDRGPVRENWRELAGH